MNLSFTRGDEHERVMENYRRIAGVLGCGVEDFVASHQTHTTNIRQVTEADRGKGVMVPRDYEDVDGLITDVPGLALVTYYADCVPLFFVDVEHGAIGLAHSGWRGTVEGMGRCVVEAMGKAFVIRHQPCCWVEPRLWFPRLLHSCGTKSKACNESGLLQNALIRHLLRSNA